MKLIRGLVPLLAALALLLGAAGAALSAVGPQAVADVYPTGAAEDTSFVVAADAGLLVNDNPVAGSTCAMLVDGAVLNGTVLVGVDGSFTYTPAADFNGMTSFTYGIQAAGDQTCSGEPGSQATVTITVAPANDAPTAAADSFGVVKNVTLNVGAPGVLGNDHDIDADTLTSHLDLNVKHGTLLLAGNGAFAYTPASGYVGPDAFSYHASDGSLLSETRVVSLTVTAIPPLATPTPVPTPVPTLTPIETPQGTIAPSPSPEVSPSIEPTVSPLATTAPSGSPSASPGSSPTPGPVDSQGSGISMPVLLVIILFVLLVGFGAALYIPRWLAAQRGEPTDLD